MIKTKHPICALRRLQRKKLRRVLSEMRKNPALSPYVDAFLQKDDERHMALVALIACSEQTPERKHVRALDHVLSAEHRLREERDALGSQIDDLAACILEKIPGEPKVGESAVDVACRFIESRSDEANGSKWAWRAVPAVLQMLLEALQGDESKREAFTLLAHGACDKEEQVKVSALVVSILRAGDNAYDARVADVTAAMEAMGFADLVKATSTPAQRLDLAARMIREACLDRDAAWLALQKIAGLVDFPLAGRLAEDVASAVRTKLDNERQEIARLRGLHNQLVTDGQEAKLTELQAARRDAAWEALSGVAQRLCITVDSNKSPSELADLIFEASTRRREQRDIDDLTKRLEEVRSALDLDSDCYFGAVETRLREVMGIAKVAQGEMGFTDFEGVADALAASLDSARTTARLYDELALALGRGIHEEEATRIARHVAHYIMNRETFAVYSAPPLDGATRVFMRTSERGWQILLGERRVHCSNLGAEARLECHAHESLEQFDKVRMLMSCGPSSDVAADFRRAAESILQERNDLRGKLAELREELRVSMGQDTMSVAKDVMLALDQIRGLLCKGADASLSELVEGVKRQLGARFADEDLHAVGRSS